VSPTGAPNDWERAHHYLWRFWEALPKAGHIGIYDRTWYGRVLVERVEGFAREAEWRRAYGEINEMEDQWTPKRGDNRQILAPDRSRRAARPLQRAQGQPGQELEDNGRGLAQQRKVAPVRGGGGGDDAPHQHHVRALDDRGGEQQALRPRQGPEKISGRARKGIPPEMRALGSRPVKELI